MAGPNRTKSLETRENHEKKVGFHRVIYIVPESECHTGIPSQIMHRTGVKMTHGHHQILNGLRPDESEVLSALHLPAASLLSCSGVQVCGLVGDVLNVNKKFPTTLWRFTVAKIFKYW